MHDTKYVRLEYPRTSTVKFIEVALGDIRAADDIRISYDFERDGWKVEQASVFEWPANEIAFDRDWQEVAFVKAWAREKPM